MLTKRNQAMIFVLMAIALTAIAYAIKDIYTGEAFKPIITKRKDKC